MRLSPGAAVQYLLPQKALCRLVYRLSRSRCRWLKNLLIRGFTRLYAIDLDAAESSDRDHYPSFNAFFTRALAPGARPLAADEGAILSPADGRVTEFGRLDRERALQAKGISYSLADLLDEAPTLLEPFHDGRFLTIYLAPHDYHRVHMPLAGLVDRSRYIPGKRFSVNAATAASIDGLFCRNERVALWVSTPQGYAVIVMVGALNVSSLTTALTGEIASGAGQLLSPETPLALGRGAELGRFNLGSTVVIILSRGMAEWHERLQPGQTIRMGEVLGSIVAGPPGHAAGA
jgi:phosphatidylserine decarboxylase